MGAVTGGQAFLKIVTTATMNPPMPPTAVNGSTVSGAGECRNWFQLQAAVAMVQSSRMPVLLTVPDNVMVSALPAPSSTWKLWAFNAGFEVLTSAIEFSPEQPPCVGC